MMKKLKTLLDKLKSLIEPTPARGEKVDLSWPPKREEVRTLMPPNRLEYNAFWIQLWLRRV